MGTLSKPLAEVVRRLHSQLLAPTPPRCVLHPGKKADVVLGCGDLYCWHCIDTWPAGATPLEFLGMTVLPGRERPKTDR